MKKAIFVPVHLTNNQNVMINRELIDPKSIVVVGGSNNVHKPGGRLHEISSMVNIKGELYVVNAKEDDARSEVISFRKRVLPDTEWLMAVDSRSFRPVVDISEAEECKLLS